MRNNESGSAASRSTAFAPRRTTTFWTAWTTTTAWSTRFCSSPTSTRRRNSRSNTSVAPAEYGRAGGAIVVSSIKSGTNQYHGSAFGFYRDRNFDSNPNYRFNGAPATPAGGFLRNQPGFSIGGPLLQETSCSPSATTRRCARRSGCPAHYLTVPTTLMRTGDFTELLTAANVRRERLRDPVSALLSRHRPASGNPYASETSPGLIFDPTTCPTSKTGPPPSQFNGGAEYHSRRAV